ncbi:MAG: DUF2909 domain-containing protein [Saccharospirillum sp.]|nr:DUF2909 domain-containing protein [Saccharospirillum sp.]
MLLKILLIVLIIAMILSLSGALVALLKNDEDSKKRTVNLLTIRVTLASLIIVVMIIGFVTGELNQTAPWIGRY